MSASLLTSMPVGLFDPRNVQRPDVEDDDAEDDERQQIMQREEAVERRVVGREAAEQPRVDRVADDGNRREQVGDHRRAPEAHLPPDEDVAHERGRHHQQEDDEAEQPQHLARRLVAAVEQAAEDVDVDDDEEERRTGRVHVAQHPAAVDVAHDVLDRVEGDRRVGRIVHAEDDAGQDLDDQRDPGEDAEVVEIVEVLRHRIAAAEAVVDQPRYRQPTVDVLHERRGRLVMLGPGEAHGAVLNRS